MTHSRNLDRYIIRLPVGMRDRIKAAAAKNLRSMNAEIVMALNAKFGAQEATTGAELAGNTPVVADETGALASANLNTSG